MATPSAPATPWRWTSTAPSFSTSVDAGSHRIGEQVTLTLQAQGNEAGLTLQSGASFNGQPLQDFTDLGNGRYSLRYTVTEGDADVVAQGQASAQLRLIDAAGNLSAPLSFIGLEAASIDAHRPQISALSAPAGSYGIGSVLPLTLQAAQGETGLSLQSGASFNGQNLSGLTDLGNGRYRLDYTVREADSDRADGSLVPGQWALVDAAGNVSDVFSGLSLAGTRIDANRPQISAASVASGSFKIGQSVAITLTAANAETGLTLQSGARFNGQSVSGFTDLGDGRYRLSYTVGDGDGDVASGGNASTHLALVDAVGNASTVLEHIALSDTALHTTRPVLALVQVATAANGRYKIGDVVQLTLQAAGAQSGLSLTADSRFNGQPLSDFVDHGDGSYSARYTVTSGDTDVALAGQVNTHLVLQNSAGNTSLPLTSVRLGNESIDATLPVISDVQFEPGTYVIGDVLRVKLGAANAEAGLQLKAGSSFNGQLIDPVAQHWVDHLDGSYSFDYTVTAGDADVAFGALVSTHLALQDAAGNVGAFVEQVLLPQTTRIDANAPLISAVSVAGGNYKIGDTVTITLSAANGETGLSLKTGSSFNGHAVTNFTELGGGDYRVSYTVVEGDADVQDAARASANLVLQDAVGNDSAAFTSVPLTGASIDANKPVLWGAGIANGTYKIGDTLGLTLLAENTEAGLSLKTGSSFNGHALTGFTDLGNGAYRMNYTVQEGDSDVANGGVVVANIALVDAAGNVSASAVGVTLQGESIDANKPHIGSVSVANGTYKIGDAVAITLTAANAEAGLSLKAGSTFNGQAVSGFTDLGGGSYRVTYTVVEGDADVQDAASAAANLVLVDAAGNASTAIASVTLSGESIDANKPSLSSPSVADGHYKVGDAVAITLSAANGETGLSLKTGSSFNGHAVTGFTDLGNGNYRMTYTVTEGDADVQDAANATANLVLVDAAGNASAALSSVTLAGESIDANTPAIGSASVASGTYKVGDVVAITLTAANGEAGLSLKAGSSFNGHAVTGFTDLGSGSYRVNYTVGEGHTDVKDTAQAGANIALLDAAGNASLALRGVTLAGASIDANTPGIAQVSLPNGSYKAGDVLTLTLSAANAETGLHLQTGASFNGQAVSDFTDLGDGSYSVRYTVLEGDADVRDAAAAAAHLVLVDAAGNASATLSSVTLSGESIDANTPGIVSANVANGHYKVGDAVAITLTAANAEAGLSLKAGSSFNGQALSGFTDLGGGSYRVTYTVAEGDADVQDAASAAANLALVDAAGNASVALAGVLLAGESIDANTPSVGSVSVANGTYKVGDVVAITLTAANGEAGLSLKAGSSFNGHAVTGFTDLGGGSYRVSYTVVEGDADVRDAASAAANLVLVDAAGNASASVVSVTLAGESIDANTPGVGSVSVANGTYKIGDTVAITLTAASGEAGLTLKAGSSFNGHAVTGFTDLGGGSYRVNYTVVEGDADVQDAASAAANLVLVDAAGNASAAFTSVGLSGESIDANRPVIAIDTVASDDNVNANEKATGVVISGSTSAENGCSVSVNWAGTVRSVQANNGRWAALFVAADVPANGSTTVSASVSDAAGNAAASASRTVQVYTTVPEVVQNQPLTDGAGDANAADAVLNAAELQMVETAGFWSVSGDTLNAQDGSTVTLVLNSKSYTTSVSANAWSIDSIAAADVQALAHGNTYTLQAQVRNTQGVDSPLLSKDLKVATALPDVPTVQTLKTGNPSAYLLGQALKQTEPGTYLALEAGDTLTVSVPAAHGAAAYSKTLVIGQSDDALSYDLSTQTWALQLDGSARANGVYDVQVSVTALYNGSTTKQDISSGELQFRDAASASIDTLAGDDWLNISESGQNLVIAGDVSDIDLVNGGNAAVGRSLTLSLDGNDYSALIGAGGAWSFTLPSVLMNGWSADKTVHISYGDVFGHAVNTSRVLHVDTLAPSVLSARLAASSENVYSQLGAGDTVYADVKFDDTVTVGGSGTAPQLKLQMGANQVLANYASGSGSDTLRFAYTLAAGDTASSGIALVANGLVLGSASTTDAHSNTVGSSFAAVAANGAYKVDTSAPSVSAVALSAKSETTYGLLNAGDVLTATVTFSEAVTLSGTATLALNIGGSLVTATCVASDAGSGSGTNALNFKYTLLAGQTDTDGISIDANSLSLSNGASLLDAAGNLSALAHAAVAASSAYKVDTTAPSLSSVALTGKSEATYGVLNAGDVVTATLSFSEAVTLVGSAQLTLDVGGTAVSATCVASEAGSGSGSNTLYFKYTVQSGDSDSDGIAIVADSLSLANGASLLDVAGQALGSLSHSAVAANSAFKVDTTAPSLDSVALSAKSESTYEALGAGDVVTVTVTFSEAVNLSGSAKLRLNMGSAVVYATCVGSDADSGSGSTALKFRYTVQNGDTATNGLSLDADSLSLDSGAWLRDVAGQTPTSLAHGAVAANSAFKVDTTAPTLASVALSAKSEATYGVLNAGDVLTATVTFSEPVYLSGNASLQLNVGGTWVTATCVPSDADSGNGSATLKFKYTLLAGQTDSDGIAIDANSLSLAAGVSLRDVAGNALASLAHGAVAANSAFKVDTTAPTLASVALSAKSEASYSLLNAGDVVTATVTFSEPMFLNGSAVLKLNMGGTLVDAVCLASDAGSGSGSNALNFKYTVRSGDLDVDGLSIDANSLSLGNGASWSDAAGNALAAMTHTALVANSAYKVDTTAPTVASVLMSAKSDSLFAVQNTGDVLTATVNFSEAVTLTGTATLKLNMGGTLVNATCVASDASSGNGSTALKFKYTVQNGDLDADGVSIDANSLSLAGGATLLDAAGNAVLLQHNAAAANGAYTVNTAAPVVRSVALSAKSENNYSVLNAGDVVTASVTFSEPVNLALLSPFFTSYAPASAYVALNIGGTVVDAVCSVYDAGSGNGTSTLNFKYTLQSGQNDLSGISIDAGSVRLKTYSYIRDYSGEYMASASYSAVSDNADYRVDTTAPTLVSSTPADNAQTVALGSNVQMTFSEAVTAGAGNLVVKDLSTNASTKTVAASDTTQVSISGSTVTLNPSSDLAYSTDYAMQIEGNALVDAAGNALAAITDTTVLNFSTLSRPRESVIDLGVNGKLMSPIQVEGNWYYVWDKNGNGVHEHNVDMASIDWFESTFFGSSTGSVITESNRSFNFYGVQVKLPTDGISYALTTTNKYLPGYGWSKNTAGFDTSPTSNSVYDDLAAVWDAYNGTSTQTNQIGDVPGWFESYAPFLTATSQAAGEHNVFYISTGDMWRISDASSWGYVALQVL